MRPKLSGNILFVFSDPGGAKPCLSLIELDNIVNSVAISDREYSFYKSFKTQVRLVNRDFEQLIDTIHPELIFTGTSYTSDIEQQFIKIAKKQGIYCYSFVDHWTSISKRFKDSKGEMIFPDKVWMIDERAKRIAIDEGIEESKLVISGNPYHDWLRNWKPSISKEQFFSKLQLLDQSQKLLVYAPDPLSNINGKEVYGFDEVSATSVIVNLFNYYQKELKEWKVLVKMHPNQDREKLVHIVENNKPFLVLSDNIDTNTLIYYADVVMGFFSSFLIEASVMNKYVLRFLENIVNNDPIAEVNIGKIVNNSSLVTTLRTHLLKSNVK
ncbi:MAG TPA: CDP-glycerol glycerophosphotransferase family protein [Bacteroidales bacterium]